MVTSKKIHRSYSRKLIVILLVVLALVAAFWGVRTYRQHSRQQQATIPSTNPASSSQSASKIATNSDKQTPSSEGFGSTVSDKTSGSSSGSALLKPSGTFVSNHRPSLGGSSAPSSEQSVCNTSPGATCSITFTNSTTGAVKTLASQTTDSNGTTYWNWDVNGAGFTAGSWQITASASLNGQSLSATDGLALEVQP